MMPQRTHPHTQPNNQAHLIEPNEPRHAILILYMCACAGNIVRACEIVCCCANWSIIVCTLPPSLHPHRQYTPTHTHADLIQLLSGKRRKHPAIHRVFYYYFILYTSKHKQNAILLHSTQFTRFKSGISQHTIFCFFVYKNMHSLLVY